MKKYILMFLCVLVSHCAFAYDFVVGKLAYNVVSMDDGTCEVARCGSDMTYSGHIVVPESVTFKTRSFRVIAVGAEAFQDSKAITISLPQSVCEIKEYAFSRSTLLTKVNIPASVTIIPQSCFLSCKSMVTINLPESIETICMSAFEGCSNMTSFSIPPKVKELKDYFTFAGCSKLSKITFPEGFRNLGPGTFSRCTGLRTIILPESLITIGNDCFMKSGLTNITIPNSVTSVGKSCFAECSNLQNVVLSQNISAIPEFCFSEDKILSSINIPSSVSKIGDSAFRQCTALKSVTGASGVDIISDCSFDECSNLSSFILPSSLTSIGTSAFRRCSKFTNVAIPDGLRIFGQSALLHINPKRIMLPSTLKWMGSDSWSIADTVIVRYNEKPFYWENDFGVVTRILWLNRDITTTCAKNSFIGVQHLIIGPYNISQDCTKYMAEDKTKELTSLYPTPPTIPNLSNYYYMNLIVYVPAESLDEYKNNPHWSKFFNIQPIPDDKMSFYKAISATP